MRHHVNAMVSRSVRLGFEVRVELRADDGTAFTAQMTWDDVKALGLVEGDPVLVAASISAATRPLAPFRESPSGCLAEV